MATGVAPREATMRALPPVQRIFIPLRSSSFSTGRFVCRIPGPWAIRYMTLTSESSFGWNLA